MNNIRKFGTLKIQPMKNFLALLFILVFCITSCKKQDEKGFHNQEKVQAYNDSVFNQLNKVWKINVPKGSKALNPILEDWKPWMALVNELKLKPVSTISAFQKKAQVLSEVAQNLTYQGYPAEIDRPDIRARYTTLLTYIQNLDMYINLSPIDLEKVDICLKDVQKSLNELVKMMEEDLIRDNYEKEEGEEIMIEEMKQMMNTTRNANPEEVE